MEATVAQLTEIYYATVGKQNPRVQKYLDGITRSFVYEKLGEALSSQRRTGVFLEAIFEKGCILSTSEPKHWNEESFRIYIRSTFSATTISDPALQLLWRSFSFYAFYPFPRYEAKVDFAAFKRAFSFLVFQCDSLIGTDELSIRDLPWNFFYDRKDFPYTAPFDRLLRSIGAPRIGNSAVGEDMGKEVEIDHVVLIEATDAIEMAGPEFLHWGPTQEQFEVVARRLFVGGETGTDVKKEDVLILLDLLGRLAVKEEKWGAHGTLYHFGDIAEAGPAGVVDPEREILADKLMSEEGKKSLAGLDLHMRIYQLWAVLFQPPPISQTSLSSEARGGVIPAQQEKLPQAPEVRETKDRYARVTGEALSKRIQGFGSR